MHHTQKRTFLARLLAATLFALAACEDSDSGTSNADWSVLAGDSLEAVDGGDITESSPEDGLVSDAQDASPRATDSGVAPGEVSDMVADSATQDMQTEDSGPDASPSPDTTTTPWVDPGEPGGHAVTTQSVQVSGDGESLDAELFIPESDELARAVLLLPGFMLSASDFSSTAERLASHGFVVLSPSFGDSFLAAIDHADLAAHSSAMLDWLEEQNALSSGPLAGRLDLSGFGASGHSRGGKIALLTAINDPRIQAVYTLDPVDSVGGPFSSGPTPENPSVTPELMDQLLVPSGFLGAGKGGDGFQPCATVAENHAAYYEAAGVAAVAYHHVDPGAGHMDFIDSGAPGLCAGGEDPQATRAAGIKTLVAFMRRHLRGEEAYCSFLDVADVDPRFTWDSKGP